MRYTADQFCITTDSEPPYEDDEIADVHAVEEDDELPIEIELTTLTEDEAIALAIEFDELDLPNVELTQEQALALIAELEAEYQPSQEFSAVIEQAPPLIQNDAPSDDSDVQEEKEDEEMQDKTKDEEKEMIRLSRAELQKRLAEIDEELELLRIRKEKRHKEQAEYLELLVQYEQERKERQEKERQKRQEEIEKKRLEREERLRAMKNPLGFQLQFLEVERPQPPKFVYKSPEELAREKEELVSERVPPLVMDAASPEAVKDIANDLQDRLQEAVGTIFDLNEKMKRNEHELNELRSRLGNYKAHDVNQFPGEPGRVIATLGEFQKGVS